MLSKNNLEKFVLISDQDYIKQIVYNVGALKSIYLREQFVDMTPISKPSSVLCSRVQKYQNVVSDRSATR